MGFIDVSAFVCLVIGTCIHYITTTNLYFDNIDLIIGSSYDNISLEMLTIIRGLFGCIVIITSLYVLFDKKPLKMTLTTRDGSTIQFNAIHYERFTTYTCWTWTLIGLYFTLTTYCGVVVLVLKGQNGNEIELNEYFSNNFFQFLWILYECTFTVSILITFIVTYILIPGGKSKGLDVSNLFTIPSLLMHNANIIFMVTEGCINKIPIYMSHVPFVVLYGIIYVLFAWIWFQYRGIFYYFFLDYGRPYALFWYIGLIIAVSIIVYCVILLYCYIVIVLYIYIYIVIRIIWNIYMCDLYLCVFISCYIWI